MPLAIEENDTLAEETTAYRERHNLTQAELADIMGVSRSTIWRAERGELSPQSPHTQTFIRFIGQDAAVEQPKKTAPPAAAPKLPLDEDIPEGLRVWLRNRNNDQPGPPVKLLNAAIENTPGRRSIRGTIEPESIQHLRIGPYQRELLGRKISERFVEDFSQGDTMPEVTLGMRGTRYSLDKATGSAILRDPIFIIDGQQRTYGALNTMARTGGCPFISVRIFIDTDEKWELIKFDRLNNQQTPDSANHAIANMRSKNPFVSMLYDLSSDPEFVLVRRIQWQQAMKPGELISAIGLLKVFSRLFSRFAPGLIVQNKHTLADRLLIVMQRLGEKTMRKDIIAYWETVDRAFDVRGITYKEGSLQAHQGFNIALARVFANHQEFWKGNDLFVSVELQNRLRAFKIDDPGFRSLCRGSIMGPSNDAVTLLLTEHFNKKKIKNKRLHPFEG